MAPTHFNLYTCMVAENWMSRVRDIDRVVMYMFYKLDQQLFRRYTRNAKEDVLYKCEFADDVALLATTRTTVEAATSAYSSEARKFGLMMSTPMQDEVSGFGYGVQEEELLPMSINGGTIECTKDTWDHLLQQVAE